MSCVQVTEKLYIPPYSGVRLIECRDHFQLVPVPDVRVVYGYGKIKACKAKIDPDNPESEPIWDHLAANEEIWMVMQWFQYGDGKLIPGDFCYLKPECTEERVRKRMEEMERFSSMTREELLGLAECFQATEDDYAYIDDAQPNYQSEPDPKQIDEYDVYHARLKVMSELHPKTVALIKIASVTKDSKKRQFAESEAVQSYFAELAHYLTENEILAWQRNNPVGTGWMCEFGEVMREPRRTIDPVNHELALNWLRQKYNEMTAIELSDSVFAKIWKWLSPGFLMTADFIKKRRERLGLVSKRATGPRPNQA